MYVNYKCSVNILTHVKARAINHSQRPIECNTWKQEFDQKLWAGTQNFKKGKQSVSTTITALRADLQCLSSALWNWHNGPVFRYCLPRKKLPMWRINTAEATAGKKKKKKAQQQKQNCLLTNICKRIIPLSWWLTGSKSMMQCLWIWTKTRGHNLLNIVMSEDECSCYLFPYPFCVLFFRCNFSLALSSLSKQWLISKVDMSVHLIAFQFSWFTENMYR